MSKTEHAPGDHNSQAINLDRTKNATVATSQRNCLHVILEIDRYTKIRYDRKRAVTALKLVLT